ncbi:hypothetical protein DFP72DRAFT_1106089 [Ephemerocybe angulata]|uniref:Uncharacterized protein n=1 Tax=Ephemerocybe angulata TaxID=980116 RepID=A0A8H6LSQ7_9AGAR|nr:hypothetical protein DFP72DRAFT_1106089 [Tulosesus angulatus]
MTSQAAHAEDLTEQNIALLAYCLGGIMFGVHCILFFLAARIHWRTRRADCRAPAAILLIGSTIMFILTATYKGVSTSQLIYAYSSEWKEGPNGPLLPIYYLRDYTSVESCATMSLMCVLVWLGDMLAIYRCVIVWNMNWWIVSLPIMLLISSIAMGTIVSVAYKDPATLSPQQLRSLINVAFPVNIAQSCLITGLIVFKIWHQYRVSCAAGLRMHGRGIGLLTIARIIVESAIIFTIQQVALFIAFYMQSPLQYIFKETLVPSIGLTPPDASQKSSLVPTKFLDQYNQYNLVYNTNYNNVLNPDLLTLPL